LLLPAPAACARLALLLPPSYTIHRHYHVHRHRPLNNTHTQTPPTHHHLLEQKAGEDTKHAAKKASISAGTGAEVAKQEAKGFGARLWGKGQVRGQLTQLNHRVATCYRSSQMPWLRI
jgi:hypothetical protein